MSLRLSGQNQLSYLGVTPLQPPELVYIKRNPISGPVANADFRQFNVGTFWLNPVNNTLWILVTKPDSNPFWLQLGITASGFLQTLTADDGTVISPNAAMNINTFGDSNITTKGSNSGFPINELKITLNPNIVVTGVTTNNLTVNNTADFLGPIETNLPQGVVQSPGGGGSLFSNEGTDGQVLISSSIGAPAWANITSLDGSVTITNGHNTIDLSTTGGGGSGIKNIEGNDNLNVTGTTVHIVTANATPEFLRTSSNTLTLDFRDAVNNNLLLGSAHAGLAGQADTAYGFDSLTNVTSGHGNTAMGASSLFSVTTGLSNTGIGTLAGQNITTGSSNIAIGINSATNITTSSNNIIIGNAGVLADSGVIRIGTNGTQTTNFQQGIWMVTPTPPVQMVVVDAAGQLGSQPVPGGTAGIIITVFNTPGTFTYTKQPGSISMDIWAWGGGGGGGGGGFFNDTGFGGGTGGAGGAAAGSFSLSVPSFVFAASEIVLVGAGGTAGAAAVSPSTSGGNGGGGGSTGIGTLLVQGGQGGLGGIVGAQTAAQPGQGFLFLTSQTGTPASFFKSTPGSTDANPSVLLTSGLLYATSGGQGGHANAGLNAAGSNGGNLNACTITYNGGAGGSPGNPGAAGLNQPTTGASFIGGTGGGGGGFNSAGSTTGGKGGNGGNPGGGGGGAASALNGGTTAAGGTGGNGLLVIVEYF